jgi:hypothetical protein
MNKPTAELKDWSINQSYFTSYVLYGTVYNHKARPDLEDGSYVRTSQIIRIDFEKKEAETKNTIYKLS